MPASSRRAVRDPPRSPPTLDEDDGPPKPSSWGCPRPARASWVGPGRLQNPRRPSRSPPPPPFVPQAVPLLLPPPQILQTARPPAGAGGTPLRGTPGSEPSAKPPPPQPAKEQARSRPRPQNLSLAAAATAGRRGRRSGRRDELVGRRGKKF